MPQRIDLNFDHLPILGKVLGRALSAATGLNVAWIPKSNVERLSLGVVLQANAMHPAGIELDSPFALLVTDDGLGNPPGMAVRESDLIKFRLGDRLAVLEGNISSLTSNSKSFRQIMGQDFPREATNELGLPAVAQSSITEVVLACGLDPEKALPAAQHAEASARILYVFRTLENYYLHTVSSRGRTWNSYWIEHVNLGLERLAEVLNWTRDNDPSASLTSFFETYTFACFGLPRPNSGEEYKFAEKDLGKKIEEALEKWWLDLGEVQITLRVLENRTNPPLPHPISMLDWTGFDDARLSTESCLMALSGSAFSDAVASSAAFSKLSEAEFFSPDGGAASTSTLIIRSESGHHRSLVSNVDKGPFVVQCITDSSAQRTETFVLSVPTSSAVSADTVHGSSIQPVLSTPNSKWKQISAEATSEGLSLTGYFDVARKFEHQGAVARIGVTLTSTDPLAGLVDAHASCSVVLLPAAQPSMAIVNQRPNGSIGKLITFSPDSGNESQTCDVPATHSNLIWITVADERPLVDGRPEGNAFEGSEIWFDAVQIVAEVEIMVGEQEFRLRPEESRKSIQSPIIAAIEKQPLTNERPDDELSGTLIGRLESLISKRAGDPNWLKFCFHVALSADKAFDLEHLMPNENSGLIADTQMEQALNRVSNFHVTRAFRESESVATFVAAFEALEIHEGLLSRGDRDNGIADWPSRTSWQHLSRSDDSRLETYLDAYANMVSEAKKTQRPENVFWASYPCSISVWNTTTTGKCNSILLSPLHPIRLAWLAGVEHTLAHSDMAKALAGPIEGWNFPIVGPSPTNLSGMLAVPMDNGSGQLFVGWSLLTAASVDAPEPLQPPHRVGSFLAPGSAASGMNSSSAESALRAFRRINPHLPTLTIDLAAMSPAARLSEVDEVILRQATLWAKETSLEMVGGLRIWDSLNRLGGAPFEDAQDITGYGGERVPLEWRRYVHDPAKSKTCNVRLLQDTGLRVRVYPTGEASMGISGKVPLRRFEAPLSSVDATDAAYSSPTFGPEMQLTSFQTALAELENANNQPRISSQVFRTLLVDPNADWTVTGEASISPSSMANLLNGQEETGQMLWEWRPPFLDYGGKDTPLLERRPFLAVARIPGAFRSQLRSLLDRARDSVATDGDVDSLLRRLGSSGVGLSSLLAMGGSHAAGALGFYASIGMMDLIEPENSDSFVIPIDACDTFLRALAGGTSEQSLTKRADLLHISITGDSISLAPIEIKLYGLNSANPPLLLPVFGDPLLDEGISQLASTSRLIDMVQEKFEDLLGDTEQADSKTLFLSALTALVESAVKLSPQRIADPDRLYQNLSRLLNGELKLESGVPVLAYFAKRSVAPQNYASTSQRIAIDQSPVEGHEMSVFTADIGLVLRQLAGDHSDPDLETNWQSLFSTPTRAVVDGPVVDGPVVDGPVVDGPVVDGPVVDGPVVDGPDDDRPDDDRPDNDDEAVLGHGSKFLVGQRLDSVGDSPVQFWPGNTALNQMNVGVVGDLGTGKTQLLKTLISELRRTTRETQGTPISFLIFDYKNDYSDQAFLDDVGGVVISPSNIPLNVFALSGPYSRASAFKRAQAFTDVLGKIYAGIGPIQRNNLVETIMELFQAKGGDSPLMHEVLSGYRQRVGAADSVVGVLNKFVLPEVFVEDASALKPFNDFLGDNVLVINLSELGGDSHTQNALVILMLDLYYEYMLTREKWPFVGEDPQIRKLNSFLLVDEATNIMQFEFPVLEKLLLQGRQYGLGVILASQYLSHFKVGSTNYGEPLRSWFVHKVPHVTEAQLRMLSMPGATAANASRISTLNNHEAFFSSLDVSGEFIRGLPYFELGR